MSYTLHNVKTNQIVEEALTAQALVCKVQQANLPSGVYTMHNGVGVVAAVRSNEGLLTELDRTRYMQHADAQLAARAEAGHKNYK